MGWDHGPGARAREARSYDAAYRRARAECLRRARWRCQIRGPGCTGTASECDHITAVAAGGDSGPGNLRAACAACHAARTRGQAAAARRARGADPRPEPRTAW